LLFTISTSFFNIKWIDFTSEATGSTAKFLTYNDRIYGIKIQYPSNWTIDKKQTLNYDDVTKIVGFIKEPNRLAGDFLVSVHNLTNRYINQNVNLTELLNSTINYYREIYDDFNLIESNYNVSSSSLPNSAYRLVWIDKEGQNTIKTMQMGTIIGNQAYLVRYYAELEEYSTNLPLVEKMIHSLKINNKTSIYR
jgi:serine/threonine-protein kinase